MLEYEHGPRLLPLVAANDGFEIEQNYVGESSCVSFERDFVFDFFGFASPSLNLIVACISMVSCVPHSHFVNNFERTVFVEECQ